MIADTINSRGAQSLDPYRRPAKRAFNVTSSISKAQWVKSSRYVALMRFRKLKIVTISTLYAPNGVGGAELVAKSIAEGLVTRGHDVTVISISPSGRNEQQNIGGVRCYYLPAANFYWPHVNPRRRSLFAKILWHAVDSYNPVMAHRVGRILDAEQPNVVHAHNLQGFSVSALVAACRRNLPVVQTLHDYYFSCPNSVMYRRNTNCATRCIGCRVFGVPRRLLSNRPAAVTAVSGRLLERLEKFGFFRDVAAKEIIASSTTANDGTVLSRRDLPPGTPLRLGYLGRLDPIKGLETVLRAMRHVPPDVGSLFVAGTGEPSYVTRLKREYPQRNILFLGFVKSSTFFDQIDALIVPSLWEEPLGLVAIEALQYGVPVFASRIGGLQEVIDEGRTGYFFAPGNSAELATLIRAQVRDGFPAGRLSLECAIARNRYTRDAAIARYEILLHAVAVAGRPG